MAGRVHCSQSTLDSINNIGKLNFKSSSCSVQDAFKFELREPFKPDDERHTQNASILESKATVGASYFVELVKPIELYDFPVMKLIKTP